MEGEGTAAATAAARQSAFNAKRGWALNRGLITQENIIAERNGPVLAGLKKSTMSAANYTNMRSRIEAAARTSYASIKAELMAIKDEAPCPMVSNADVEFLAFAMSELMTEEQIEMISTDMAHNTGAAGGWQANMGEGERKQGGGSRFKQKGGALGAAVLNFFRSLCGRGAAFASTGNQQAAANVEAVARAIDRTSHGDITRTLIVGATSAGAIGTMMTGQNQMATLALTALNIVRSVLPNPGMILANTYRGIVAWGPVGAALAPVLANLAIIYACFIAIKETNAFIFSGAGEGLRLLSTSDYQGFLTELCNRIFSKLMQLGAGSIQARVNHVANVRRRLAEQPPRGAGGAGPRGAGGAGGGGGGGGTGNANNTSTVGNSPPGSVSQIIAAAVRTATPGLTPVFRAAQAQAQVVGGTGLGGGGGGGSAAAAAAGPLPTITEDEAAAAADAATEAGEEAERRSQAGPVGGAAAAGAGAAAAENNNGRGLNNVPTPQGSQGLESVGAFNNRRTTSTAFRNAGATVFRNAGNLFASQAVVSGSAAQPATASRAAVPGSSGGRGSAPGSSGGGAKRSAAAAAAAAPVEEEEAAPAPKSKRSKTGKKGGGGGKGKSRKQHGGKRNKKTRKNRK